MRNNESSLFVFIACIIIGVLISLNINFNRTYNKIFLTTEQYQDAYNQRNKLRNDISDLDEQYTELYSKLQKFQYGDKSQSSGANEIKNELTQNEMQLGKVDVQGQGINITLKDISNDLFYNDDDPDLLDKIIHNFDITYVINDLKSAGAEAIAINGQRIIDTTEVICDGSLLRVNGVKIASPFYISAIGNKDVLKNYMLSDDGWIKFLMSRSIDVSVDEADNIKIQAFSGDMDKEFLSQSKNK